MGSLFAFDDEANVFVRFAIIAGATISVAVAAPKVVPGLVDYAGSQRESAAPPVQVRSSPVVAKKASSPKPGRRLTINADVTGHFTVEATVGSRRINLMVDTGATIVALNETTAKKLGIRLRDSDYRKAISTANGVVPAAPVVLPSMRIGGIRVRDVEAVVIAGDALQINLLGMSFLGRLSQFQMARGRLILTQ